MVPTKRLWILLGLGIPFVGIAAALDMAWMGLVYNAIVLFAAWGTARLAPSTADLRVQRVRDPVLSVRVPNRVELKVLTEGPEPIRGVLRDEPPPPFTTTQKQFALALEPGREKTFVYHTTPWERGSDYFRGTYLRLVCPLGLVEKQVKLNTEEPVRVYPNILALREFDLLNQKGRLNQIGIRHSRIRGLGSDFESLREYAEGDDFRKIDWKATARKGKLVVRQYEQERNQPVLLCIDSGRHMLSEVDGVRKLDHVLDSVLMLMHAASVAGDFIGLLVYSDTVKRYIPPRKGRNQIGAIIEAVHDLVAEPVESDHAMAYSYLASRWKRRSLLVSFADVGDPVEAKAMTLALSPLSRRHITLLARVADPRLDELVGAQLEEPEDLYRKAAALSFRAERKQAESILTSSGIHSLDAEPQHLAAELVSFYFVVKEKSLL
jgi:uncharacterized protein (DUF58 family)